MGRPAGWMQQLTGRDAMRSPGAPSLRREVERQFWVQIATGITSERAAEAVGVSQAVGSRWFRHRGGMPLFMSKPVSGRYLLRCDGDTTFVMKLPVGSSVPLFDSTVGRVCLAGLTEEARAPLLRQLQQHSPDQGKLWLKKLAETQEQLQTRGFVVDDGEASAAVRMAALPLLSPDRSNAYTLLCGGPSFALPPDLLEERIGPALVALAKEISPALPCGNLASTVPASLTASRSEP